jgi:hypothetical protein
MKVTRRTAGRVLNPKSSEYEATLYPTVVLYERKMWPCEITFRQVPCPFTT